MGEMLAIQQFKNAKEKRVKKGKTQKKFLVYFGIQHIHFLYVLI